MSIFIFFLNILGYGAYGNEYSYTGGAGAAGGGGWMTGTQVGGSQASPGSASKVSLGLKSGLLHEAHSFAMGKFMRLGLISIAFVG